MAHATARFRTDLRRHFAAITWLIALPCLVSLAGPASAIRFNASTSSLVPVDVNAKDVIPSVSDFDSASGAGATIASSQVSHTTPFDETLATVFSNSAFAEATSDTLRVDTSLSVQDYDPVIQFNEGAFVRASAQSVRRLSFAEAADPMALVGLYFTPIFQLDGTLQSSSDWVSATIRLGARLTSPTVPPDPGDPMDPGMPALDGAAEVFLRAPADGSLLSTDSTLLLSDLSIELFPDRPYTLDLELTATTDMTLQDTATDAEGNTVVLDFAPAGDHSGIVDFSNTVSLVGFAVFEDAELTLPFTGDVAVFDENGAQIAIVPIPEPGTALLLALGLAGLCCGRIR